MYFTRILFGIILFFVVGISQATDYRVIVPLTPGSQCDVFTRAVAESVSRTTGDNLIVLNVPGGDHGVAATQFRNDQSIDLISTTSLMVVFNPVLKKNLTYSTSDFDHLIYGGTGVALWVTRPNTNLKTPDDLVKHMPPFVGAFTLIYNFYALTKEKNLQSSLVSYKGINETMLDLLNGSIDLAILSPSSTISQMVKTGKLHIIGSSYNQDMVLDGINVPSITKQLGVSGFNGFCGFAGKPDAPRLNAKLKKLIWESLQDPAVQESMKKMNLLPPASNDQDYINNLLNDYRARLAKYGQFQ
jgi:tripartite-type tricarboxylate transporter receptor subunit TctC